MSIESLLSRVISMLRQAGIDSMLTGSLAAAHHGAGRATMDIDVVIDPHSGDVEGFVSAVGEAGLYASLDAAREAIESRTSFNIVDPESGWKVDMLVLKDREFSRAEFSRRQPAPMFGIPLEVVTVEDLIIAKLEWAQLGESDRQLEDVRALVRINEGALNLGYLDRWSDALGLRAAWNRVRPG